MFCRSCGEKIRNGENFCGKCGHEVNEASAGVNIKKKKNIIIGTVCMIFILGFIGYLGLSNEYVEDVKNGAFNEYPNVTVGESFDSFFADPEWSHFVADDGRNIVEFKGECTYDEQNVDALVQFEVHEEGSFEITYFSMNNISQNMFMISELVDKVAGDYSAKAS